MQAYKDGIRSNQLGWHLLVSVLQLGRHITINDLLGDFLLPPLHNFTQTAATRPQLFINFPAFQASLLVEKVNSSLGCQHGVGWMPWNMRSCGFYSASGSPWVLGCLAAHHLISRAWRGRLAAGTGEGWDSPPPHALTLISVSPSLRDLERRFNTLQQSYLSGEWFTV